ncbi:MAG: rRNA maturation RNase YbeY [Clostridiales bacterium]|nr:rRNA maturation RNase YbeY [Clostridiales bacterium]
MSIIFDFDDCILEKYNENEAKNVFFPYGDPQSIGESVLQETLDYLSCPFESVAYVMITDNESIREINKEQRGIDAATDVLSFPANEFAKPGVIDDEEILCFDPESGELVLGDIVISIDKVKSQSRDYGHSEKREYAFLIAHSLLHLFGFDHMTKEEAEVMEGHQNRILKNINITREV